MSAQTMPRFDHDVRKLLVSVVKTAPRSTKVSRETFVTALRYAIPVAAGAHITHHAGPRSRLHPVCHFLSKIVGYGPATLNIEAKEILESALDRAIAEGRDVVTLQDLRTAAQSGN